MVDLTGLLALSSVTGGCFGGETDLTTAAGALLKVTFSLGAMTSACGLFFGDFSAPNIAARNNDFGSLSSS